MLEQTVCFHKDENGVTLDLKRVRKHRQSILLTDSESGRSQLCLTELLQFFGILLQFGNEGGQKRQQNLYERDFQRACVHQTSFDLVFQKCVWRT